MNIEQFLKETDLLDKTEIEKVKLLAFFHLTQNGLKEFLIKDMISWFAELQLHKPNQSRLRNNIIKSKAFINGSSKDAFQLHLKELKTLESTYPILLQKSEEIVSNDIILPQELFINTRGYIETLAKQINASFEYNIFDGCAVLMRRLLEILLILSYEKLGIEQIIKDSSNNYKYLEAIINDAQNNSNLNLSRNTKNCLDDFRKLGNFSAHKIYYNCKKPYIEKVIIDFRAAIEELLYKSGLKV